MRHNLKTHPDPFAAVLSGAKRFEVRKAGRPFAVGDEVLLQEWEPGGVELGHYTGAEILCRITYLVRAGEWGLPADVCVFGFETESSARVAIEAIEAIAEYAAGLALPERMRLWANVEAHVAGYRRDVELEARR